MPRKAIRCDGCGRFTKREDVIGCASDDEEWVECVRCCSQSDLERHQQHTRALERFDARDPYRSY